MRGCPSAEEKRIDLVCLAEPAQLALQSIEIGIDQVIPPGDQREIAVAAAVAAERNVDIGRGWRVGLLQLVLGHHFMRDCTAGSDCNSRTRGGGHLLACYGFQS